MLYSSSLVVDSRKGPDDICHYPLSVPVYTDHNTQLAHNMGSFEINTSGIRNNRIMTHQE